MRAYKEKSGWPRLFVEKAFDGGRIWER